MVDIDGVNVVPVDPVKQELELLRNDARLISDELTKERRNNASMARKMRRVREVAKELETVAPHAAILIEGALER